MEKLSHYNYCTLFDSYYLDKGIVMAESLAKVCDNYNLYIFAFDRNSYDILSKIQINNTVIIFIDDVIDKKIELIRNERTKAEFCWSMTPFVIFKAIELYGLTNCTYIDADLMFFDNPNILVDEMTDKDCSVQIIEHRYRKCFKNSLIEKLSGKYCVQFNSFLNNEEGMAVLREWKEDCFECCTSDNSNGTFGDQKYLDLWQDKYNIINVIKNEGAGVAPWNLSSYCTEDYNKIKNKKTSDIYNLIFYHFQNLSFYEEEKIDIGLHIWSGRYDEELIRYIYYLYLTKIYDIRNMLEKKYNWKKSFKDRNKVLLWNKGDAIPLWRKLLKIALLPYTVWQVNCLFKKDEIDMKLIINKGEENV